MPGSLNDPLQRPKLKLNAVPTIFDHIKKNTARKYPKDRSATNVSLDLSIFQDQKTISLKVCFEITKEPYCSSKIDHFSQEFPRLYST